MIYKKMIQLTKALNSGAYHQGKGRLVSPNDKFCCLGVACNISEVDANWELGNNGWEIKGETVSLPPAMVEEFGFYNYFGQRRDKLPVVINGKAYESLAAANDAGCTFKDISKYMKANYKAL